MMRIVVTEFPKSGGSWITSLIGDALGMPKRDIYVGDGYDWFDLSRHPWYEGAERLSLPDSCVIKSHELPGSALASFDARGLHLVRDGRDVVVSRYFYERDFCVRNGLTPSFDVPFPEYVRKTAAAWRLFVDAWQDTEVPLCRYEAFLENTADALVSALGQIGLETSPQLISDAVGRNTRERTSRSFDRTFRYNTFVRRGIAGDWVNHFTRADTEAFLDIAGKTMRRLGYDTTIETRVTA